MGERAYGVTEYEVVTANRILPLLLLLLCVLFFLAAAAAVDVVVLFYSLLHLHSNISLFAKTFGLRYLRKSCALLCSWSSNKNKRQAVHFHIHTHAARTRSHRNNRLCRCAFVVYREMGETETDASMDIVLSLNVHIWYTPNGCRYMFQATELCEWVAPPFRSWR